MDLSLWAAIHEIKKQNMARAKTILAAAIKLHPNNAHSWKSLADLEIANNEMDLAKMILEKAVENNPFNKSLWQEYAEFERKRGGDFNTIISKASTYGIVTEDFLKSVPVPPL